MPLFAISERRKSAKASSSVSVVVLNFDGKTRLRRCLDSLIKTDYPNFQIVVVDNGSSDGSIDLVKEHYPGVKVIQHDKNYGFALGYNLALDFFDSQYVALVNNDIVVEPNWLIGLIAPFQNNKNVAATTPKMLFLDAPDVINAAGGSCDIFGVGLNRGNGEVDRGQYDTFEEVFYGNGGALVLSRKVWRDVGQFDERYFMYGEDLDWCWRARLKGYTVVYVPKSKVYHEWRGSHESRMAYVLERHWLSTMVKNYQLKTLISVFPKYIGLKILKAIWLLKNGNSNEKFAVLRAFVWNLRNLKTTWQKHVQIQASRKLLEDVILRRMVKQSFELSLWLGTLEHPILRKG